MRPNVAYTKILELHLHMQNYQPTSAKIRVLLVFILSALVFYAGYRFALTPNASSREGTSLGSILDLISKRYVDTINAADLESKTLQSILQELDPHSVYIDAKDVTRANEGLVGNFQGIGVEFLIYKDTVRILKCIPGGPSEKAGLHAGDCILNVFSKSRKQITLMGKETTEDSVFKYLRGPESSKIEMEIYRFGAKKPEKITLERAEIPIESIDCAFFIKPYKIGRAHV